MSTRTAEQKYEQLQQNLRLLEKITNQSVTGLTFGEMAILDAFLPGVMLRSDQDEVSLVFAHQRVHCFLF